MTLKKYFSQKRAKNEIISERELLFIALQLLSAVDHLKKYKVAHRDIKDDNIFIAKGEFYIKIFFFIHSRKKIIHIYI